MDANDQAKLQSAQYEIEKYLANPFTQRILEDSKKEQEQAVKLICDQPITDLESFFNLFQTIGHLRGLRRAEALLQNDLDEIKTELESAT